MSVPVFSNLSSFLISPLKPAPLEDAVEWEIRKLEVEVGVQSPYIGMPSYDSDKAWHDLFEHSNIRITPEELARLNRTSILLDSGHYWAYPGRKCY